MNMRDLIPWGRQSSTAPVQYQDQQSNPMLSFRREMDQLFDDLFRGTLPSLGQSRTFSAWPSLELSESDSELRITVDVPGMNENDIELLLDDGMLTLRGEKRSESNDSDRGYSERYYGRFERRIALPSGVDEQAAKADFKDGVLTVTLPKCAEAERGRRIPISAETRH